MAAPKQSEEAVKEECFVKSRALEKSFSDVVRAVSAEGPLKIGVKLFALSLVSRETLDRLVNVQATSFNNSTILVMNVLDQVKLMPEKLDTFMKVLQSFIDKSVYEKISARMCRDGVTLSQSPVELCSNTASAHMEMYKYNTDTTVTEYCGSEITMVTDDEITYSSRNEGYNDTMVVLFLSGLSPSTLEKALRMDVQSVTSLRFRAVDLHRLFKTLFIDVAYTVYNLFHAYMLGYLIANSSCHWEARIACYKDSLPMFISGISNSEDGHFGLKLALHIDLSSVKVPVFHNVCRLTMLPAASTLRKIIVRCTRLDAENDIVAAFARMSRGNKALKELQILSMFSNHDPHGKTNESACALAKALCENDTLETLNLECIGIGEDEAKAFASMLKENTTLKELSILEYSFSPLIEFVEDWVHIFNLLSSSLEWNRTLRRLQVTTPYSFGSNKSHKSYYKAILAKCASSTRLFTSLRD